MSSPEKPKKKLAEEEFNDLVNTNSFEALVATGSFDQAYRTAGFSPEDVEFKSNTNIRKSNISGVYVDIEERAENLLKSLGEYSNASRINGFKRAMESERHYKVQDQYGLDSKEVSLITNSQEKYAREGDFCFLKAIGYYALTKSINDNPNEPNERDYSVNDIKSSAEEDKHHFLDQYIGKDNGRKRAKSRRDLGKQIIRVRQTKEEIRRKEELGE